MAPLTRALVISLGLCGCALSIPADPSDPSYTLRYQSSHISYPPQKASGPWTRLRDIFVHRIWGPSPARGSQSFGGADPKRISARYGRDLVLRFNVSSAEETRALAEAANTLYLDIWEAGQDWVDIRMAKDAVEPLLSLLPSSLHNAHSPVMHDLAQAILETYPSGSSSQQTGTGFNAYEDVTPYQSRGYHGATKELFFKDYQPLSVIVPWMRLMASLFPTHVQFITVGQSYEGRDIPALRIGVRPLEDPDPTKPRQTILVSGGSHAREWISTTAVNYVASSLITHYGKTPDVTKLLREFDWVFIPTMNPDGYVYTWDHDRLWRKNRQETSISFCPGIDLGRSFGFQWDGDAARNNPCLENYAGDAPFDGFEADQFARWANNETNTNHVKFAAFLDLHSYSQEVLYPYSFSCDQQPPTLENLEELALGLAKAIRLTHSQMYTVMSACEGGTVASRQSSKDIWPRMEPNGGSALDWFYHELGVKYAYQVKLRDTGNYGFLLPSSNISPTGQEMFNAILELGDYLLSNKGIELVANRGSGINRLAYRPK